MKYSKIKSYAKLNLVLNVTGKLTSLHKIETIVSFALLHDEIFIKKIKSDKNDILFTGQFSKNISNINTVSKLLEILEKRKLLNNKKFKIRIKKKIPNKAGLGGGSMNAAFILNYFQRKGIIKATKKKLFSIAKLIGSDVVLGLDSSKCIKNEKNQIKRFKNCKNFYILIVKPNFGCSTKEIYSKVRKFEKAKLNIPIKKMFDIDFLKKMENSLETIAFSKYPKLKSIKFFLQKLSSPIFVRMTGSGSALVAYFQSKKKCDHAKKKFNRKYKNCWCITSKTI